MQYKGKVDKINEEIEQSVEKEQKEIENLKLAVKEIFNNVNGFYFLKFLKKISFWDEQDMNINMDVLAYKKGRRDIWLIIRNILPKDILAKIEIYAQDDN